MGNIYNKNNLYKMIPVKKINNKNILVIKKIFK